MAEKLPLPLLTKPELRIRPERYESTAEEVQEFIESTSHLNTKTFAKDVMFSHEIKANNSVEGYYDDVKFVKEVIEKQVKDLDPEQRQRILNLYKGYRYILQGKEINPDTLRDLYAILSKDLLCKEDRLHMGEYYREAPVYIFYSSSVLVEPEHGMPEDMIDRFMDAYFKFLNSNMFNANLTEEYIKSQILHFYFVYIHPYFDVNGRTSRTTAMWYLLNKKAYPFIIFNRGINFRKSGYYTSIQDVRKFHDISFFINYMLETVKEELEKEYIMQSIQESCKEKLTSEDWQSILYLLSMKCSLTISDFAATYNRFNPKRKVKDIYDNILMPLIEKGIITPTNYTKHMITPDMPNMFLEFNPDVMNYDHDKILRLTKYK